MMDCYATVAVAIFMQDGGLLTTASADQGDH